MCSSFGIAAGVYLPGYDYEVQGKVNCFVDRLYVLCLGRHGDIFGQQNLKQFQVTNGKVGLRTKLALKL